MHGFCDVVAHAPCLGLKLKQYIHGDGDLEAQTSKEVHQMITKLTT